jgi:hypothetical protein
MQLELFNADYNYCLPGYVHVDYDLPIVKSTDLPNEMKQELKLLSSLNMTFEGYIISGCYNIFNFNCLDTYQQAIMKFQTIMLPQQFKYISQLDIMYTSSLHVHKYFLKDDNFILRHAFSMNSTKIPKGVFKYD